MNIKLFAVLMSMMLMVGCKAEKPPEPQAVHIVLCWLKNPGNVEDRQTLVNTSRTFLGQIPGLLDVQTGPALDTARPGADSSFDVGVVFTFESEKALRAYDTNPIHQAAVRDVLKPRAEKIAIYDFIDKSPVHRLRKEAKPYLQKEK